MPITEPKVIVHHLNMDPDYKSIQQKRFVLTLGRYEAIQVEVEKLEQTRFIKKVIYPTWFLFERKMVNRGFAWILPTLTKVPEG